MVLKKFLYGNGRDRRLLTSNCSAAKPEMEEDTNRYTNDRANSPAIDLAGLIA
jgi:hypothetical protein